MNFVTFEDFKKEMGFDKIIKPSFEQFFEGFFKYSKSSGKHILVKDWVKKLSDADYRKTDTKSYMKDIYDFLWEDYDKILKDWFFEHVEFKADTVYKFDSFKSIVNGNVINGRYYNHSGRLLRNLFYKNIYLDTKKSNTDDLAVLDFFIDFYLNNKTERHLLIPSMIQTIKNKDSHGLFIVLLGTYCKASIFNPYTYSYIIETILKGKKLLCPVMSWGSPVMAYHNSSYNELVGIDVIPDVIDKAKRLDSFYESQKSIFENTKQAGLYCCPSEKIDERLNFTEKYKDHFDTVFFSPPYYDLEMYSGGEQSIDSFKTYEEWLEGYWTKTVELCYNCLSKGGKFSFVIIPRYKQNNKTQINISEDMLNIAKKYFTFEKHYQIAWGGFSAIKEQQHEKILDIREDFWILRKD